jgi:hypothetical protein
MKNISDIETRFLAATPEVKRWFLSACIEHVVGAFSRVAGLHEPTLGAVAATTALLKSRVPLPRVEVATVASPLKFVANLLTLSNDRRTWRSG